MKILCVSLAVLSSIVQGYFAGALRLLGLSTAEDLSEEQVETIEHLHLHPLPINYATRQQLVSGGLLTDFQAASIVDYISHNGPVLSLAEFSAVPGIGTERARDLSWFVTFDCDFPHSGAPDHSKLRYDVSMLNGLSHKSLSDGSVQSACSSLLKAKASGPMGLNLGLSAKSSLSAAYLSFDGRRLERAVVGDFNVRWGQGLVVWSGMSLAGVSSVDAFCRNPTGISPTNSSMPGFRGAAAQVGLGKFSVQGFLAAKGIQGLHVEYLTSRSLLGASAVRTEDFYSVGADYKGTVGKISIFAEGVVQLIPSQSVSMCGVGGVLYNIGYRKRTGVLLRSYSRGFDASMSGAVRWSGKCRDEFGVAAGGQFGDFLFTADYSRKVSEQTDRLKARAIYSGNFVAGEWNFSPKVEYHFKFDGVPRNEIRVSGGIERNAIMLNVRGQWCTSDGHTGVLAAAEGGMRSDGGSISLRGVYFNTSSWTSRLYCYARDVPGSFSVPAYYGEGFEVSLYAGCRLIAGRVGYVFARSRYRRLEFRLYLRMG